MPGPGGPHPGVHRGSRRGASTLASGGAKRHQAGLCSRHGKPRGLPAPKTRARSTLGPRSSGAGHSAVLMQRSPRPRRAASGGRTGAGESGPRAQPGAPAVPTTAPAADPALLGGRPRRRPGCGAEWLARAQALTGRADASQGGALLAQRGRAGAGAAASARPQSIPAPQARTRPPRFPAPAGPQALRRVRGRPIRYLRGSSMPSPPLGGRELVLKTTTSYHFTLSFFLNHEIKLFKS